MFVPNANPTASNPFEIVALLQHAEAFASKSDLHALPYAGNGGHPLREQNAPAFLFQILVAVSQRQDTVVRGALLSSADATQAKGLLAFTPVGLPPTEHVCFFWTHSLAKIPPEDEGTLHC